MIFGGRRNADDDYHEWFAWRPVMLYGPMEWDREKVLKCWPRIVWLQTVLRWRDRPRTYYALPIEEDAPENVERMNRYYGQKKARRPSDDVPWANARPG